MWIDSEEIVFRNQLEEDRSWKDEQYFLQIVKTKQAQEGKIVCQESLDGQIVFCMFVHLQENLSQSYYVTAQAVAQRYNNKRTKAVCP